MEAHELHRRLDELRERIRERLDEQAPAELPDPGEAELELEPPPRDYPVPGHPNLNSTAHLEEANRRAEITGPIRLTSAVPVVGSLLTGLRRLLRPLLQALLDPYLDRQERFNVEVVRHLNELGQRLEQRIDAVAESLRRGAADPTFLERRLEASLADYDAALRERHVMLFDALEQEVNALESAIAGEEKSRREELQAFEVRFVERAQAVDRRFDEKDAALERVGRRAGGTLDQAELHATRTLLERALEKAESVVEAEAVGDGSASQNPVWANVREWLQGDGYRAFQQRFRGDLDEILERFRAHVDLFDGVSGTIADLGCGRGEFLQLLEAAGHEAVGVEINAPEVEECRRQGLDAVQADLFDWLEAREPQSLGGIFMAEVIEHLPPPAWEHFVQLASTRLASGGRLVVETINPESLYAMARAYVLDPTHVRPVHPDLLAYLATRAGFYPVDVRYQAPVPDAERVLPLAEAGFADDDRLLRVVRDVNQRLRRIDKLCCAPQEYVLYAERPASGT